MNFKPKFIPRFQEGGMPQQGLEQDPIMVLAQMSQQALQNQDCQMAMLVCQAFLQVVQQAQGGGGGGEAPAPEEEQGEPVYAKNGAKLIRRYRRAR